MMLQGLYYCRAYYYNAGRFLSRDDKINLGNVYAYVANNPLTNTDPMGAYCWNPFSGDCWRENARDFGSDLKNGATIVGNTAIQGTTTAVNAVVKTTKDTYPYVEDHCLGNWGDAGKCALIGASAAALIAATGGAAIPAWALGAATAVAFTASIDCFDGCLTDSWQGYAGSAVAGGLFGWADNAYKLTRAGQAAWGALSVGLGNVVEQGLDYAANSCMPSLTEFGLSVGLGAGGGALTRIRGLNMGQGNYLGRFNSVANSGNELGWRSYRNVVLGAGVPGFISDAVPDISQRVMPGGAC